MSLKKPFTIVARYKLHRDPPTISFRDLLEGLDRDMHGLFVSDVQRYVEFDGNEGEPMRLLTGQSGWGMRASIVQAQDDEGRTMFMPLLRDDVRRKSLMIGPANLADDFRRALRKQAGLRYEAFSPDGCEDGPGLARHPVTRFVAASARRHAYLRDRDTRMDTRDRLETDLVEALAMLLKDDREIPGFLPQCMEQIVTGRLTPEIYVTATPAQNKIKTLPN